MLQFVMSDILSRINTEASTEQVQQYALMPQRNDRIAYFMLIVKAFILRMNTEVFTPNFYK
jgi:hypothetical protein